MSLCVQLSGLPPPKQRRLGWDTLEILGWASRPGAVEIESHWTATRREQMGMSLGMQLTGLPHPSKTGLGGAPSKS